MMAPTPGRSYPGGAPWLVKNAHLEREDANPIQGQSVAGESLLKLELAAEVRIEDLRSLRVECSVRRRRFHEHSLQPRNLLPVRSFACNFTFYIFYTFLRCKFVPEIYTL